MIYILNKIKKFYVHNKALSLLGILSLIISILYIISIDWPEWYYGLGNVFELIYNLSLAYLGSLIFYIIQVYIPDTKRKKGIRIKIFKYLFSIHCGMFTISNELKTLETCLKSSYNSEEINMLSNKRLINGRIPRTAHEFDEFYLYNINDSLSCLASAVSIIENLMDTIYSIDITGSTDLEVINSRIYFWIEEYKSLKNIRLRYLNGSDKEKLKYYECIYSWLIKLYDIYSENQIRIEIGIS